MHTKTDHQTQESINCRYCKKTFISQKDLESHVDSFHQFNCMECDHQAHQESDLKKHMETAHKCSTSDIPADMQFKCVSCAQHFARKDSLMTHRRDTHGKSKTKCRYNIPPLICKKGEKDCAYDHTSIQETSNAFKCTVCNELFPTKSQVLNHRKNNHPEKVPMCKSIKN